MSVKIEVQLDTGASMAFNRSWTRTSGTAASVLRELDAGYTQIRDWLLAQLPPAEQARLRGAPATQDSRPRPEERSVKEIVRETIEDDLRTRPAWRL